MTSVLKTVFVIAIICAAASASCIRGGGEDKEDKNVTKAGTEDVSKSGMHLKIEITLIYRKRSCTKCLLESMGKLNGLLITYIRGAILLRVVHQAVARLTLLQQSFQFVRFVRMAKAQLVILNHMRWAFHLQATFQAINALAAALIRFVHGEISAHTYAVLYRTYLLSHYNKVSHLLVKSLSHWKKTPGDLEKKRKSVYGLMMLTHLLWTERYLYERLINYEGSATVEKDRDDMMKKMQGFFVTTKISFKYKKTSSVGSQGGYKVVNGRAVREKKKPVTSLLDKWKNRGKTSSSSSSSSSGNKKSSLLGRWKNRKNLCKAAANGAYIRDPSDCSKYFRCVHGEKQEHRCGPGLRWDQSAKVCNWAAAVTC